MNLPRLGEASCPPMGPRPGRSTAGASPLARRSAPAAAGFYRQNPAAPPS
jgi:hypothetical protein